MIGQDSYVRCSKVGIASSPIVPTPSEEDYEYGKSNPNTSIPMDYWVTGELVRDPEVGWPIHIVRDCRNGVRMVGEFMTSVVTSIEIDGDKLKIDTKNSSYILEEEERLTT